MDSSRNRRLEPRDEIAADGLLEFGVQLLRRRGVPERHARTVSTELLESDLWDQAGHGFHRLPYYLMELEKGDVKPRAKLRREIDSGLFLRVASDNFGQVAAQQAIELACERVGQAGACVMGWRRFHHIGRAGAWVWKVAERGFAAILFVNTWGAPRVRPYGGISPVFGTSPIAFALPGAQHPEMIDFSGAAMVEGKIRKRKNRGEPLPPGCVIDRQGRPTRDPRVIYRRRGRGSIRALGGDAAEWKGSALLAAMDLFAGLLTETGYADGSNIHGDAQRVSRNGALLIAFPVDAFIHPTRLYDEMQRYVQYVKAALPATAAQQVSFPGEAGFQLRQQRLAKNRVPIDPTVRRRLVRLGREHGVAWQCR